MMIDAELELSDAQAVTTGTQYSDVYDLHGGNGANVFGPSIAGGDDLFAYATVNTAFADGTSLAVTLETSATEVFTAQTPILAKAAVLEAALLQGLELLKLNLSGQDLLRFIRFKYVTVGTHTAGAVDAVLVETIPVKNK